MSLLSRRVEGTYEVDPWGLDADVVSLVDPLLDLRWSITITGAEVIPADGPAVLVANRRVGVSEPFVLARAVRRARGRDVRFLGVPDVAPIGPVLRRLGGALDHPAEVTALLRAGEVVAVGLGSNFRSRHRAGPLEPESLAPAVRLGVPLVPVAVVGRELGRAWRVVVGESVPVPEVGGPLALAELADATRRAVQRLLDEANPPGWLFQ